MSVDEQIESLQANICWIDAEARSAMRALLFYRHIGWSRMAEIYETTLNELRGRLAFNQRQLARLMGGKQ